jgi:NlpC/P60 family putative phage cell wall peptidase
MRDWLGTPFHLNAVIKGAGCDCYGLVRGIFQEKTQCVLSSSPILPDMQPATLTTFAPLFLAHLAEYTVEIPHRLPQPNDILLFSLPSGESVHLGIAENEHTFIHAVYGRGVIASRYTGLWAGRHRRSFQFLPLVESAFKENPVPV